MTDEKKIPEGRLGRFARLASLGARTGASMLMSKDGSGAAQQAAEVLGTLRGIAAKVGQMASYIDGVVPDEHQPAYEAALRSLRAAAPSSSPEAIRAMVEEELKAPISELFGTWEDTPMASASIGQVHRATMPNGQAVAVKVQHPGIAKAVESDLENAGTLEIMLSPLLGGRKVNSKGMLEEIRKRFREELDYELEAERQWQFLNLHRRDRTIRIPRVVDERSSKRVLTTTLVQGKSLEEASQEDDKTRKTYAETLWRFVFKGNLVGGKFNADPHPGNYIFQPEGRVAFLDFGCVQPIENKRLELARDLHQAALKKDEKAFARMAATILETKGGRYEELAVAFSRRCFDPIFHSPFRVTKEYVASLVRDLKVMAKEARGLKDGDIVPLPPGMLFMNRLQFGFYSVLARLDIEADFATVEKGFLAEAGLLDLQKSA